MILKKIDRGLSAESGAEKLQCRSSGWGSVFRRLFYRVWMNMEQLFLVLPAPEHRTEYDAMMAEWSATGDRIHPGPLRKFANDYQAFLANVDNYYDVSSSTYFMTDSSGRILGAINIRNCLNERLLVNGGHIGYGVRPSERRKGYAKAMLSMALGKCRESKINRVLLTCEKTNLASVWTILACGGMLENEVVDEHGTTYLRYWVALS